MIDYDADPEGWQRDKLLVDWLLERAIRVVGKLSAKKRERLRGLLAEALVRGVEWQRLCLDRACLDLRLTYHMTPWLVRAIESLAGKIYFLEPEEVLKVYMPPAVKDKG